MKHQLAIVIVAIAAVIGLGASGIRRATPLTLVYPANFGNRISIPDDNPMTEEGVQLGRRLFYETRLSANNRVSCATCHQQAKAFTDGLRFSQGVDDTPTPRNAMSLANLLWVRNFFWDGRAKGLEAQASFPLTDPHEMGQSLAVSAQKLQADGRYASLFAQAFGTPQITGQRIVQALAQFERTLISANSKYDQYLRGEYQPTTSELNGLQLFFSNPNAEKNIRGASCGHCHGGPKTFIELFHNNGLDTVPADKGREVITGQSIDRGRFRVATLRNIALTAPYMHDGRFANLEDVVDHYNEHIQPSETLSTFLQGNQGGMGSAMSGRGDLQLGLTTAERKDLLAFLHLLTDSSFIQDKRFSNPFIP
ncbi:cytochrome-c peroxidase [Paraflavitalea pollutisoli]|uniref:cytochrome-c peroxidase n=1 Tax=Paraflavitalea pollutisoli TaxID=3034143 RepID=UPI0023EBBFC2|nr:cytochrome c peroxidase [Paraflavitalea sp. H1-2-19X]